MLQKLLLLRSNKNQLLHNQNQQQFQHQLHLFKKQKLKNLNRRLQLHHHLKKSLLLQEKPKPHLLIPLLLSHRNKWHNQFKKNLLSHQHLRKRNPPLILRLKNPKTSKQLLQRKSSSLKILKEQKNLRRRQASPKNLLKKKVKILRLLKPIKLSLPTIWLLSMQTQSQLRHTLQLISWKITIPKCFLFSALVGDQIVS